MATKAVKRARTLGEISREGRQFPIHKSYGARDDLRRLAVCNNINGPIAPSGLMTLHDDKVTCKRCLRIIAGKPIAQPRKKSPTGSSLLDALMAANLRNDALKLVERLALYWVAEGSICDEPGSSKEAFELLITHGYAFVATAPAKLLRPDGSEVTR